MNLDELTKLERVVRRYPEVKAVATTLRDVHSTNRHAWTAVAWVAGGQPRAGTLVRPGCIRAHPTLSARR
jgi:hypothetical protein